MSLKISGSKPRALKAYIDQIVRVGVTVSPLTGKKATIILASGGDFSPGSAEVAATSGRATLTIASNSSSLLPSRLRQWLRFERPCGNSCWKTPLR